MKIENLEINSNRPVFIIAEAGINHNNELDLAYKMIDVAVNSGANAIKFQTWSTDLMQLKNSSKPFYQKSIKKQSYYELIKSLEPSKKDQKKIFLQCKKKGIIFLSTPYDEASVDFLDSLGVSAFKISSSDLTNHILLKHVAKKNKPILLSTGLSDLELIKSSVNIFQKLDMKHKLILLQATSNYPTPPEDINLRVIPELIRKFNLPVGLSDHTINSIAGIGAVALGACVLEKHFTLSRKLKGPDQSSSLEPKELQNWISQIRYLEKCLGTNIKSITDSDKKNLSMRKILVLKSIKKNMTIQEKHLTAMRGNKFGVLPLEKNLKKIIGKKIKTTVNKKSQFSWDMI